ncbi:carbohydrate ABC transporter membrane protein 2 (CUT1 family) [Saccharopolyspora erythraea NRRL 2338]|uniref:Binding-protein-dependent transport systems membrane component n=2 Tax=Saccharopolyspora erythraea TaxID=1836 RepID=A4F885_SACEN|nr:carbohydrate ABC transporter permease [Saccharopolyspora erythraea]EQD84948.1 sugar ABC transporter permease [Saccharopolyspora erythraea D]PFG94054.1 carbohydrate ABC transporter membrane protein 2 (CUT1 family) [Saccharopolyspora erythraea NRRL 2338]QRK90851.1 carbohydrate ABC transporter permease [Saccharopolyspora erythraea]CAM00260.1 binding-protein-dependent transport systems membrane component [Saccharopolyspora erythraea NRRL 2338]
MTTPASPLERGGRGLRLVVWLVLGAGLLWTLVPLGWMVLSSFKSSADVTAATPQVLFTPTLENYRNLFTGANNLGPYVLHSVLAAGISAVLAVAIGAPAGYGLARTRMRGRKHLSFWIISTRMAPIAAVVLPLFLMFRGLGLIDSVPGLVLAYLTFDLPFAIWLMSAFFAELPPALEESAQVEGCTRWQAFWHVVLPMTKSGLVTTFVLCLVFAWNDHAFALVFSGPNSQTLPIAAGQLVTQSGIDWGQLTAIGTFVVVPMVLAGLAVRRWLVTGLTLGAVTGE